MLRTLACSSVLALAFVLSACASTSPETLKAIQDLQQQVVVLQEKVTELARNQQEQASGSPREQLVEEKLAELGQRQELGFEELGARLTAFDEKDQRLLRNLEEARQAVLSAAKPAARARALFDECTAILNAHSWIPDYAAALAERLDAALGQSVIAKDEALIQEGETWAARLLEHGILTGSSAQDGDVTGIARSLILDLWAETAVADTRAAALEAGNVEPYGEAARWFLLAGIRERQGDPRGASAAFESYATAANARRMSAGPDRSEGGAGQVGGGNPGEQSLESMIAAARSAWYANGDANASAMLNSGTQGEDNFTFHLRKILSRARWSEQPAGTGPAAASPAKNPGLASLVERAASLKQDDPFWSGFYLLAAIQDQSDPAAAEAAFSDYFARYPDSAWGQRLLLDYYRSLPGQAASSAQLDAIVAKLSGPAASNLAYRAIAYFAAVGEHAEAVAWLGRATSYNAPLGPDAIRTMDRLATGLVAREKPDKDALRKVRKVIRDLLSDPDRASEFGLTEIRQLKAIQERLESRKSDS